MERPSPEVLIPLGTRFVGTDRAARALGVSRQYVYALMRDGVLRSVSLGRRRLIAVSELDRLVDELLAEAGAEAQVEAQAQTEAERERVAG